MTDNPTPYEVLGGEQGVRELVDRFYDHMDALEEVRDLRAIHARSLKGSRRKLFEFLSGWLGGPDLYIQHYGHPRLRMRHLPFSIGVKERDQWMQCMRLALNDMSLPKAFRDQLESAFQSTADHMRNRAEHSADPALSIHPGKG